jgi:hypothetical protein
VPWAYAIFLILGHRGHSPRSQLLLYHYESLTHFVQKHVEASRQNHLLRIDHHISAWSRRGAREADGFAQSAFHAISLNRAPQGAAHRKSDPKTTFCLALAWLCPLPLQVKNRHQSRKVAPPLLVHALEICVP